MLATIPINRILGARDLGIQEMAQYEPIKSEHHFGNQPNVELVFNLFLRTILFEKNDDHMNMKN